MNETTIPSQEEYGESLPPIKKNWRELLPWAPGIVACLFTFWMISRFDLGFSMVILAIAFWGILGYQFKKDFKKWKPLYLAISLVFIGYATLVMSFFTASHFTVNKSIGYGGYFFPLLFIVAFLVLRTAIKNEKLFTAVKEDQEPRISPNLDIEVFNPPDFETLIVAAITTNIFYLLFTFLPIDAQHGWSWLRLLHEKFAERGSIPVLTVWIFFWAMIILFLKRRRIAKEQRAEKLILKRFPNLVFGELPERTELQEVFTKELAPYVNCIFSKRLALLTEFLKRRDRRHSLQELFASQAEAERNMIVSSHTAFRFIIWAIPILGFLGTVWGISLSVSQLTVVLSGSADASIQGGNAQTEFGPALAGLGIAFDTTVVSLSLSLIAMLFASYIRKMEDDQIVKAELLVQQL